PSHRHHSRRLDYVFFFSSSFPFDSLSDQFLCPPVAAVHIDQQQFSRSFQHQFSLSLSLI
ncbi:hypothetical protein GBA52_026172, partial [Prunus armeniaca]